ncbi:MAG: hypothetical protein ABS999_17125, partial [Pseudomonas atacamensis]|uniref:hypothetical protein n=1 Tax=Pseudomonas atacamensis TaxID=2565368 RepID=UPI003315818C
ALSVGQRLTFGSAVVVSCFCTSQWQNPETRIPGKKKPPERVAKREDGYAIKSCRDGAAKAVQIS